ncbi:minor tail domain protein, partial [Escherichia coli 96.0109]
MLPAQSLLFSRLVQDRHRAGYPAYLKDKAPGSLPDSVH